MAPIIFVLLTRYERDQFIADSMNKWKFPTMTIHFDDWRATHPLHGSSLSDMVVPAWKETAIGCHKYGKEMVPLLTERRDTKLYP